ncbi:MAG: hypothetical protein AMXMBFR56_74110 [Polyangiaceae bacterium]
MATDVTPIPGDAFPVWIDDTQAYLGLPAVPVVQLPPKAARAEQGFGIDKKPSPNDGFVNPLADAIERRPCGPNGRVPDAAVLYAPATMDYRVVIDALYTLVGSGKSAPGFPETLAPVGSTGTALPCTSAGAA